MKGTNLGEFEDLVLLTVAALMKEAYSVAMCGAKSMRDQLWDRIPSLVWA